MNTIKKYLNLYKKLIVTNFSESSSFRINFFLVILMDIFFYISSLSSIDFLYNHVSTIGPWNRDQLLFFISFMLVVDNLHMSLLSESFWVLSQDIKSGQLDFILLTPVNTVFNIFFRHIRPSSVFYSIVSWSVLIYLGIQLKLTPLSWICLPFLVLLAFSLLAILEILISTLMFFMTEGIGINFLRMQMQNVSRWPDFIFSSITKRIFKIFIPILIIGSAPVGFLLDNSQYELIFYLLMANILMGLVLIYLWPRALKHYESASS